MLGVAGRSNATLVLIVSGHPWAREIAMALKRAGVAVRMWVGPAEHQAAAREAGIDADHGRLMVDAINRENELEEVTDALILTRSDDFNTLAAAEFRNELGHLHVYRTAPDPSQTDLLPPSRETGILGDRSLTFAELDRQFAAGARLESRAPSEVRNRGRNAQEVALFTISRTGRLRIASDGRPLAPRPEDTAIVLVRTDA